MTQLQRKHFKLSFQKLDIIDSFSLLLWLGLLIPVLVLPGAANYTFPRTIFFILWVAAFALYVGIRIAKEKRLLFYSTKLSSWAVFAFGLSAFISYLFSASKIDSLYGYDLSFSSSVVVGVVLVALYFLLRTAGFSLELAVSRVLATLPASLVILDVLQLAVYLVVVRVNPQILDQLFGNYAGYFAFAKGSAGIFGNLTQILLLHIFALVVLTWQIAGDFTRNTQKTVTTYIRYVFVGIVTIVVSYLLFTTVSIVGLAVMLVSLLAVGIVFATSKSPHPKKFAVLFSAAVVIALVLGGIWWKFGMLGSQKVSILGYSESRSIVQQSFQGSGIPIWRHLVGFGSGTFPYLYMKYRSLGITKLFTNDTFFFKPATYVGELYVEQGALGVVALISLIGFALAAIIKATRKASLIPEGVLLAGLLTTLLLTPSSLSLLVVFFVVLASLFDKAETLPEALPTVKAIDLKETAYTNRSISRMPTLVLSHALMYALVSILFIIPPFFSMLGYARSIQRFTVARQQSRTDSQKALVTYYDAFNMAAQYKKYCTRCSQLSYVSLSSLLGINDIFATLPAEQRSGSQDMLRNKGLLLQSTVELLGNNALRYDYWQAISQAYRAIVLDETSQTLQMSSLQSVQNVVGSTQSQGVNPYSVDALYLYIDLLLRVGANDVQANNLIKTKLQLLTQIVGTPIQVQFIQGIVLAREKNYDGAINVFEGIKDEVAASTALSEVEKNQLAELADKRISEVKKLKADTSAPTSPTTIAPKPTLSITATPMPNSSVKTTVTVTP